MSRKRKGEISITYMSGPLDGKTMTFEQPDNSRQRVITIGRREGCDIHMPFDNQVSRLHARIGVTARKASASPEHNPPIVLTFWIEDGGSRNGTFIEKNTDPLMARTNLRPGTLFRIGRTWLRLDVPMSTGFLG